MTPIKPTGPITLGVTDIIDPNSATKPCGIVLEEVKNPCYIRCVIKTYLET